MASSEPTKPFPLVLSLLLGLAACDDKQDGYEDPLGEEVDDEADEEAEFGASLPDMGDGGLESCVEIGDARPCEDDAGMQFCGWQWVDDRQQVVWGECLHSVECLPGDQSECEFGGSRTCALDDGVPYWPECPFTPLLLRFDDGPIELAASSAAFDIANVGECLDSDWPAAVNPWLAIDLDKSGSIDAGDELFGSGSMLRSGSRAPNGFAALAELDSNQDGIIDATDARFDELLVWRDEDADKLSTLWELTSLTDEGIERIELDFVVGEQCDARGNCGRERSRFVFSVAGQRRVGEVVDVYLACD
ncbi:MAG: hypothetical protein R6X02_10560 [Enhygromyxa sp.]